MKNTYQDRLSECVSAVIDLLPGEADEQLRLFAQQFYAKMPLPEMEKIEPARAAAIVSSAYAWAQKRKPGQPKIRIFTPHKAEHGYESSHTIVELVNDDKPFLVDSLSAELTRLGFVMYETIHPILAVQRDGKGILLSVVKESKKTRQAAYESFIHFEISALPKDISAEQLQEKLELVLAYVQAAVEDWQKLIEHVSAAESDLTDKIRTYAPEQVKEAAAFMQWLRARNFVFLGYRDKREKLGVCTQESFQPLSIRSNRLLEVSKSDHKSLVHRPVLMDVITIKRFDKKGAESGECQFYGLFTSSVYYQSTEEIPLVRSKLNEVLERSGFDPVSHDGKALKAILEFLPRDELFQYTVDELFDVALGILALEAKPAVRLFVRRDAFERFVSCMVFIPREYFATDLRIQIQESIAAAFHGTIENYYTQVTDSPLARLHIIVRTQPGAGMGVDTASIEAEIASHTHLWSDALRESLLARHGEGAADEIYRRFSGAFPPGYKSRYGIGATTYDIDKLLEALGQGGLAQDIYRVKNEPDFLHLKIYNAHEEIALSDILPVLENMGLRVIEEQPFQVAPDGGLATVWIRDIKLTFSGTNLPPLEHVKPLFEEALGKIWVREMENDRFNALILSAGVTWRQVSMLRAYAKYLKQIGFTYSQAAIEQALNANTHITKLLVGLFMARFDPASGDPEAKQSYLLAQIESLLAQVASLADDRVLRRYSELMGATLRTNFFQHDGKYGYRPVMSFKLDSRAVPDLPLPRPFAEIFVYSPRVEGIHLRGGKVARGGLRWSDRPEDFRTEVLGLMKAQMVKNAVIVPSGSKGGFVLKQPPAADASREALQKEGIACYTLYLQGLLDLTDNIVDGKVVAPALLQRYDGDDPYLVVAADKGTASFSDIANSVSRAYNFWLDDAFASGGSAGYDHKEMAITARGGWISVVRHFREMGVDIGVKSFTAIGIGDMAGDVFGNGMLLSDTMKLVAAFNHQHIFIDPEPDAMVSFEERKRLFHLPRSTWKDYDAKLLSKGGGIFERSAKTVSISPEAKAALGLTKDKFTPEELIRAILLAPVDLLWNGGIGTYVKADSETHDQVGDRANNAVRVNGAELRCKVVGEGGNLGFTQRGRIEYARSGGRINTDAIDNSGGVDCSDHEVNIKIALQAPMAAGRLTRKDRDALLLSMTEEVAGLVLMDNTLQTQAISLAEHQGASVLESQARLMQRLERQGLLDRAIEYLPPDKQIADMRATNKALTRPELAVLLAYSKIALMRELMDSKLPDEPYFAADLLRYFPGAMQEAFAGDITKHPLKREIVATVVTNSLVNRTGITFFFDVLEDSALPVREVAAAYTIARDAFSLRDLWKQIEQLSGVAESARMEMLTRINRMIERVTLWLLRHTPHPLAMEQVLAELKPGIAEFRKGLEVMHSPATRKAYDKLLGQFAPSGIPGGLAREIASLEMLSSAGGVIRIAQGAGLSILDVGQVYFAIGAQLRLGWLRHHAGLLRSNTHWDRLAIQALLQDLYDEQRRLTTGVLAGSRNPQKAHADWTSRNADALARFELFIEDLKAREGVELSALLVALKHVRMLG